MACIGRNPHDINPDPAIKRNDDAGWLDEASLFSGALFPEPTCDQWSTCGVSLSEVLRAKT
jgi:hypothetical protein